jgi:hypothetical protein
MADNCSDIHLVNFSVATYSTGQAEGLLMMGGKNIVSNMNIAGSGDALQLNDSVYIVDSALIGAGDSVLTRGPLFFDHCDLTSNGAFMWIRNTEVSHGVVYLNSRFIPTRPPGPVIARAPTNGGKNYSHAEVVLINCQLGNLTPELWGPLGGDTSAMHFWEYNSTNISDGMPADTSKRLAPARQLTKDKDAEIIANYSNPTFVLGGWTPAMAPLILQQPQTGGTGTLTVKAGAVPPASFQWSKDGASISGAIGATLKTTGAGNYRVTATNSLGSVESAIIKVP